MDGNGNIYIADFHWARIHRVDPDGVVTTFAGTGDPGFSGDGGPATQAGLVGPRGMAVDAIGNVYIADGSDHRIRRVDPDGVITTFAGTGESGFSGDGGPATQAGLFFPTDVGVDSNGSVYIADLRNYRIRRVDRDGVITTFAGTGESGFSGDGGPAAQADLSFPQSVAVDATGNVCIADSANHRIRRVDPNDDGPSKPTSVANPSWGQLKAPVDPP